MKQLICPLSDAITNEEWESFMERLVSVIAMKLLTEASETQ